MKLISLCPIAEHNKTSMHDVRSVTAARDERAAAPRTLSVLHSRKGNWLRIIKLILVIILLFCCLIFGISRCLRPNFPPLERSELLGFWGAVTEIDHTTKTPVAFVGFEFREDGTGFQYTKNYYHYSGVADINGYTDDGAHPISYSIEGSELTISFDDLEPVSAITKHAYIEDVTLNIWMPFELTGGPTIIFAPYNAIHYEDNICVTVDTSGLETIYDRNATLKELTGSWVNTNAKDKNDTELFYSFVFRDRFEPDGIAEFSTNAPSLPEKFRHLYITYTLEDDILTIKIPASVTDSETDPVSRFRVAIESMRIYLVSLDEHDLPKSDCSINLGIKWGELPIPSEMFKETRGNTTVITEYELAGAWVWNFGSETCALVFNGDGHGNLFFKNYEGLTGQFPMTYRIERVNHVAVTWQYKEKEVVWDYECTIGLENLRVVLEDVREVFPHIISTRTTFYRYLSAEFDENNVLIVKWQNEYGRMLTNEYS